MNVGLRTCPGCPPGGACGPGEAGAGVPSPVAGAGALTGSWKMQSTRLSAALIRSASTSAPSRTFDRSAVRDICSKLYLRPPSIIAVRWVGTGRPSGPNTGILLSSSTHSPCTVMAAVKNAGPSSPFSARRDTLARATGCSTASTTGSPRTASSKTTPAYGAWIVSTRETGGMTPADSMARSRHVSSANSDRLVRGPPLGLVRAALPKTFFQPLRAVGRLALTVRGFRSRLGTLTGVSTPMSASGSEMSGGKSASVTPASSAAGYSGSPWPLWAAAYASVTWAGMAPRLLTSMPCSRAHARTSLGSAMLVPSGNLPLNPRKMIVKGLQRQRRIAGNAELIAQVATVLSPVGILHLAVKQREDLRDDRISVGFGQVGRIEDR